MNIKVTNKKTTVKLGDLRSGAIFSFCDSEKATTGGYSIFILTDEGNYVSLTNGHEYNIQSTGESGVEVTPYSISELIMEEV